MPFVFQNFLLPSEPHPLILRINHPSEQHGGRVMVCRACGSEAVGSDGICTTCGARNTPTRSVTTDLAVPEPPPIPARPGKPAHDDSDPAATNPSSGFFCGRCGSAIDPKSDYCGICGNPLNEAAMQRAHLMPRNSVLLVGSPAALVPEGQSLKGDERDDPNDTAPRRGKLISRLVLIACIIGGVAIIGLALAALIAMHARR
jgi:ribosomal protein L37E